MSEDLGVDEDDFGCVVPAETDEICLPFYSNANANNLKEIEFIPREKIDPYFVQNLDLKLELEKLQAIS